MVLLSSTDLALGIVPRRYPDLLLVMFNDPESKERVMSSLRCLTDADV